MNTKKKTDITDYTNDSVKSFKQLTLISPEELKYVEKMTVILNFLKAKRDNPGMKKKELCDLISVSDSSLKRIMKDLGIGSFYRYKVKTNRAKTISNPIDYLVKKIQRNYIKNIYQKRQKIFGIMEKDLNEKITHITPTMFRKYLEGHNERIQEFKNILETNIKTKTEKIISKLPQTVSSVSKPTDEEIKRMASQIRTQADSSISRPADEELRRIASQTRTPPQ